MNKNVIDQDAPKPNDQKPVWDLVIEDMKARDAVGRDRYGTPLQAFNGRDALMDAYQEALDMTVYLRQAIAERDGEVEIKKLRDSYYPLESNANADIAYSNAEQMITTLCKALLSCYVKASMPGLGSWNEAYEALKGISETAGAALMITGNGYDVVNRKLASEHRTDDRKQMVRQFMTVSDQPIGACPHVPDKELVRFRLRLIGEEFIELMDASLGAWATEQWRKQQVGDVIRFAIEKCPIAIDMVKFADATVDLDYVIEGTRLTFGIDSTPLWAEVHGANMKKVGGPKREDGKLLKPEGWVPPNIAGVLKAQGWEG